MEFYRVAYSNKLLLCDTLNPIPGHIPVSSTIRKFSTIRLHGNLYRSAESGSKRGSHIQALFLKSNSEKPAAFPGEVLYYFEHDLAIDGKAVTHTFAVVRWYKIYRSTQPFASAGLEIWEKPDQRLERGSI